MIHSLICSLREIQREQEDEVSSIGKGNIGCLLAWRAHGILVPSLFIEELLVLRRAQKTKKNIKKGFNKKDGIDS
jgi:hypothetical protein